MAGGGFMHDANRKLSQNKSLRRDNSLFNREKGNYSNENNSEWKSTIEYTEDTKNEIKEILAIQNKEAKTRFFKILITSIIGGLLIAAILYIWIRSW